KGNEDDDDDDQEDKRNDEEDQEEDSDDEQTSDEEEFINPSLTTHTEEETRDGESFDPISKTPKNTNDEGNGEENLGTNVDREEGHDEEEEEDELYRDVNIIQRRGIQTTQEFEDSHVTLTPVNPDGQQQSSSVNLYKALVEAYESDKIILDTYGETITLKRCHDDDADKDEEPSAGSYKGSKRRKKGKEPESGSAPKEKATRSAGKSTQRSKSRQTSASESAIVEEPMQTTFEIEEPSHPEFETGADDQPIVEPSQHPECELAKQSDSRSSFNELIDTPVDFSNFLMNRLKVDTLTPELLAGPTYELMKGSCKSPVELEFFLEEGRKHQQFYGFAINRESARDVYSKHRVIAVTELKIVEWHNYKHLDWITVRRDDDKLYKFKEGNFKRLRIQDIEDMLLLLVQGKLTNLTVKERFAFNCKLKSKRIIYQNKDKKNRLMQIDKLHKFSDGMLTDVRTALDDRPKGIRMKHQPKSIWWKSDKDKAATMIQAIDKMLKTRRIMRSLERFVGGRLYEGDFRMLQRTI
nr:hypothetical protein [Tanacetum cinerariifolium]